MNREWRRLGGVALGILLGVSAVTAVAQQKQPAPDREGVERTLVIQGPEGTRPPGEHGRRIIELERSMQGPAGPFPPAGPGDFIFYATEMSFGGKLVKGAPYSAQAVTESTQTLSDGNRIVNRSTAAVYRDNEGRTRREQTLRAIGPFATGGEPPQTIFISDPVAGTSYSLDPRSQTARKMPPMRFEFKTTTHPSGVKVPGPPRDGSHFEVEIRPEGLHKKVAEAGVAIGMLDARNERAKTESLGSQNIEGVAAEGTRTTITIPAGEIGNERPIEIVSERWYSPELQTIVMTRHSDPRSGENSYRLTNINRTEPARSLFEVPSDYVIREEPVHRMRTKKPVNEE